MARMFPETLAEATNSPAERRLFPRIRDETPDDWVALHSLGLKGHSRKMWAEADFVLVTPLGVWVIEVKGGSIQRHGREWFQNGKNMGRGPFDQSAGAAGALRQDLFEHLPEARGACVANAVAFPDVLFDPDGPDIDRDLVYDERDLLQPFATFIERVSAFHRANTSKRTFKPLGKGEIAAIVRRLAGDFELVASLRSHLEEVELELYRLTEGQRAAVAGFEEDPRATVIGSAGTGKTLLAVEESIRLAEQGNRVLLCCLNPRLAEDLAAAIGEAAGITVVAYGTWQVSLIARAGRADDLPDAQAEDLRHGWHPLVAAEAFADLDEMPFTAVVVDEAQDLMLDDHLDFFDSILEGGLVEGAWRFFFDPFQDVHGAASDPARHRIEDLGRVFKLRTNCRNTMPIAVGASLLAGRRLESVLSPEGKPIADHWYGGKREQRKQLGKLLRDWLSAGVRPDQIAVLSTREQARSAVSEGLPQGVPAVLWSRASGDPRPDNAIEFSEIRDFKGLEAPAVAVVDVDDLATPAARADVYVAASRATTLLGLFYDNRVESAYREAATAFGERLRSTPA